MHTYTLTLTLPQHRNSLFAALSQLELDMNERGLDKVLNESAKYGDLSRPRRFEIAAAINRLRSVKMKQN